jgi:uncharacterized protein (DUF362 family)/Pyruvate/2-oxoacid:ferredoxin oxidoreductase delta subunit
MKKKVVILKIDKYETDALKDKLEEAILKYFSFSQLFPAGSKVLLKPNLLMAASPEEAIVTHPLFVEAIGNIFKEKGYPVFVADSSGGFISNKDADYIYEATGIKEVAARGAFELLYPQESRINEGFPLCWWTQEFKMINLPKLKTHDIMILTLAVKNLYGCISGLHKSHLHYLNPKTEEFTKVIIKLYKMIKPSLNIVDGILALEGEGPAKRGSPRKLGIVVLGDDALYTDYAISRLLGLDDEFNPLIKQAKRDGLLIEENLEVVSQVQDLVFKDFKFPPPFILNRIPSFLFPFIKLFLKFKPMIDIENCTGCAVCKKVCPAGAIEIGKKAHIDHRRCIMCMCCSEMCRFGAVNLNKSVFLKLFDKFN